MENERQNAAIKDSNVSALRMKPIDKSQILWYNNSCKIKSESELKKSNNT